MPLFVGLVIGMLVVSTKKDYEEQCNKSNGTVMHSSSGDKLCIKKESLIEIKRNP